MESASSISKQTLEANQNHKNALDAYTAKLQSELLSVEKLIAAVEQLPEDEIPEDPGDKWCLHVENAFKPTGIIDLTETRQQNSPFYEEYARMDRYMKATVPNPFSNSEKRYLEKAVVKENKRLAALRAKQNGGDAFEAAVGHNDFFLNNTHGINWASVARDVSTSNSPLGGRTAQECKIRWLGAQHPKFNNGKWSDEEEERLRELVDLKRDSRIDWDEISQLLGTNRTPLDCIRRYQAGVRSSFRWTKFMDKKLMDAVRDHGNSNWTLVATLVSAEVSANQCQIRYTRTLDPAIKRGRFSAKEDELLELAVETHGSDWLKVAQAVPGRTNVQCRDRYMLQLEVETVKTAWTDEEDAKLKNAVKKFGNHWEKIREEMGCVRLRTQYANRYRLLARRETPGGVAGTSGNDACETVFQGGPSGPLEAPAIEQEDPTNIRGSSQGNISQNLQTTVHIPRKDAAMENGAKRGPAQKKETCMPPYATVSTPQLEGDKPSDPSPRKRPRPKPRLRVPAVAITADLVVEETATTALEPESSRNSSQEKPRPTSASKESIPTSNHTPPSQQLVENTIAHLAGEVSDLTDIDDLGDAPSPSKKSRMGNKTSNKASSPSTRISKGRKPPISRSRSSYPTHSMRTRSSTKKYVD